MCVCVCVCVCKWEGEMSGAMHMAGGLLICKPWVFHLGLPSYWTLETADVFGFGLQEQKRTTKRHRARMGWTRSVRGYTCSRGKLHFELWTFIYFVGFRKPKQTQKMWTAQTQTLKESDDEVKPVFNINQRIKSWITRQYEVTESTTYPHVRWLYTDLTVLFCPLSFSQSSGT